MRASGHRSSEICLVEDAAGEKAESTLTAAQSTLTYQFRPGLAQLVTSGEYPYEILDVSEEWVQAHGRLRQDSFEHTGTIM